MSALARRAQPAPVRRSTAPRPALRLAPPPRVHARRTPFVLFALLVTGVGLVGLLLLNTLVEQDAFAMHALEQRTSDLRESEQRLRAELAQLENPRALAAAAATLGLVPAGDPVFLRPDGVVLGNPVPVPAPPAPPAPTPAPTPAASATPTAESP